MPLPSGNVTWPPTQLNAITPRLTEWSAWYSGNSDLLTAAYGGNNGTATPRPSQLAGGIVGRLARMFWGTPTTPGQQRTKLHVPIAADIATASSDLLFGEEVTLITEDKDKTIRERLDVILEENSFPSLLLEAGEIGSALGGVYLRVTWDEALGRFPIITAVHADAAWPEFSFGRLVAVTFWQVISQDNSGHMLRHLERHEKGRIEHGLYQGTRENLGTRIPLTESTATADLTVDEFSGINTGYDKLTAEYFPNMKPNRLWRSDPVGACLGRSDFDGVEPLMDSLDETYTSWMRDIRLGKGRVLVPNYMLNTGGVGGGASFNLDQEVFSGLSIPPSETGSTPQITLQQFKIRHEEHSATSQDLLARIISSAGYSLQTFGMGGDGVAATATEVNAREKKSMTTREKKTRYWGKGIANIIEAVLAVDKDKFNGTGVLRPKVEFSPTSQPSIGETSTAVQALRIAEAASTETLVKMIHPDWDQTAVGDEVGKILAEKGVTVPDPASPQGFDQIPPGGASTGVN